MQGFIDRKFRKGVDLCFQTLVPEQNGDDFSGVSFDHSAQHPRTIRLKVTRFARLIGRRKADDENVEREAGERKSALNKPQAISEGLLKEGITHETVLAGGKISKHTPKTTRNFPNGKRKDIWEFEFVLSTAPYLDRNNMRKTPIPLQMYSWHCLDDQERKSCFKLLQRSLTLEHATPNNGQGEEEDPRRWLPWNLQVPEERQVIFEDLQERIDLLERGHPPKEIQTKTKSLPVNTEGSAENTNAHEKPAKDAPVINLVSDSESEPEDETEKHKIIKREIVESVDQSIPSDEGNKDTAPRKLIRRKATNAKTSKSIAIKREKAIKPPVGQKRKHDKAQDEELARLKREDEDLKKERE
ncbi:hypothetical protein HYALB_00014030 [Hymenoscyphus albidus]|uniref:Uncharacterized protein n=1 Tax=Hymenoscyphus albidus TaxID=595503 RepID=A0A9N9M0P4_9HELO|nr:hypothetical protein HYALB_00014030 [Hymenoscyphus albidus]